VAVRVAQYPGQVWDGKTPRRPDGHARLRNEVPDYPDYDQLAAEIIATQTHLDEAIFSSNFTSITLAVPPFMTVTGSPLHINGTITLGFSGTGFLKEDGFHLLTSADLPTHEHSGADITSGLILGSFLTPFTGSTPGAVPTSTLGDQAKYLRGDGVWADPDPSSGTVTSVALTAPSILVVTGSPITNSGTIALSLSTQTANTVFAGPGSGGVSSPTFRSLVAGDLPTHEHSGADITSGSVPREFLETMVGSSGVAAGESGAVPTPLAADAGKYLRGDATWAVPPQGTVTSVALTVPSILSISGSPITTAGTLALGLTNQAANTIFAGPTTGSSATPSFRSLVALDLPSHVHSAADLTSGTLDAARLPTMVGDSGAGGTKGAVPAPATGDATKFLRGDATWATPATNPGTVTSVALAMPSIFGVSGSPITSNGTITVSLSNQNANLVLAGPATGAAAAPTYRSLVADDLPTHTHDGGDITTGLILGSFLTPMVGATAGVNGTQGAVPQPVAGQQGNFLRGDGTWANPSAGGTVTSVSLTAPSILSVAGSPITTSGTLALTLATQSANLIWAGPTAGGAATPTFRSLVAADLPTHNHSGGDINAGTVDAQYLGVMTGDSGSGGAKGAVPAPLSGDATRFLRGDATWATPATGLTSVALAVPSELSVSGSPLTVNGTITVSKTVQSANTVWAGPTSGGAATSGFRALVAADIPTHNHSGSDINSGTVAAQYLGVMTGDSGSGGAKGAVPAPGAGDASKFLTGAGTWALPTAVTSVALSLPSFMSVSGSPVTSTGTLTATLAVQSPNTVFAGPNSGVTSLAPTFRALVAADLPSHNHSGADITSGTVGRARLEVMLGDSGSGGASGAVPAPASGDAAAGRFLNAGGSWTVPPGLATVTSVALALPGSVFSISGSPVTTNGTLTGAFTNQTQNTVFAGSNGGGSVAPTFRALVAADIPSLTKAKISDLETITTTSTASAIPKADGSGKIANAWLNTGSGNGLDADTVDGVQLAALVQTSRTITTNTGIAGGGDLSANRTLTLDINGLSAITAPIDADYIPIYNSSTQKKVAVSDLALSRPAPQNLLINGSFRVFQRGGSSFADDTYCLDRWYALTQTAAIGVSQLTAPLVFGTMNYCRLTQSQASAQRMGIAQIVEAAHAQDFNGRNIVLQFTANGSTSYTLRSAILGWTGTADAVTSDVVNTWTSTTYTINNFFINNASLIPLSVQSHAITTTGTTFKNEYTWSGSTAYNNIIILFWTDATAAQNQTLNLGAVGLYLGTGLNKFVAPTMAQEVMDCKRFYEKTFALTTAPATTTNSGSFVQYAPVTMSVDGSLVCPGIRMVNKVKVPTMTIYNPNSGGTGSLRNVSAGNNQNVAATTITTDSFEVTSSGTTAITLGDLVRFHWVADAEL